MQAHLLHRFTMMAPMKKCSMATPTMWVKKARTKTWKKTLRHQHKTTTMMRILHPQSLPYQDAGEGEDELVADRARDMTGILPTTTMQVSPELHGANVDVLSAQGVEVGVEAFEVDGEDNNLKRLVS